MSFLTNLKEGVVSRTGKFIRTQLTKKHSNYMSRTFKNIMVNYVTRIVFLNVKIIVSFFVIQSQN